VDDGLSEKEYVCRVLEAYRTTPGTTGAIRRPDRMLAADLCHRGVSVAVIENALILAAARRMLRPEHAPPLQTIHSLAYFVPVIEEVQSLHVSPNYFRHLRHKLASLLSPR
jgi:hypothetical protein